MEEVEKMMMSERRERERASEHEVSTNSPSTSIAFLSKSDTLTTAPTVRGKREAAPHHGGEREKQRSERERERERERSSSKSIVCNVHSPSISKRKAMLNSGVSVLGCTSLRPISFSYLKTRRYGSDVPSSSIAARDLARTISSCSVPRAKTWSKRPASSS